MSVEASLEFGISLSTRVNVLPSWDYRCDAPSLTQVVSVLKTDISHVGRTSHEQASSKFFLCWSSKCLNDRFL